MLLAAISSLGPTCCFCHNASHTAEKCPLLLRTKSDLFAKHIVLCLLQESAQADSQNLDPHHAFSATACLNTWSTPQVHAINLNEELEPNDIIAQPLPPDAVVDQISPTSPDDNADETDLDFYYTH